MHKGRRNDECLGCPSQVRDMSHSHAHSHSDIVVCDSTMQHIVTWSHASVVETVDLAGRKWRAPETPEQKEEKKKKAEEAKKRKKEEKKAVKEE